MANKIVAVDFDGTIVTHAFPDLGLPVPNAIKTLKRLMDADVKLILWTMRSGKTLDEAVDYCTKEGIIFWGLNENPIQREWTNSPKAYAPIYIDDAALGCPLLWDEQSGRHMVDWSEITIMLEKRGILLTGTKGKD